VSTEPRMVESAVRSDVYSAIAAMTDIDVPITDDSELRADLAFDSIRLIELTMVLERHFELPQLDSASTATVTTVGDVIRLVTASGKES
jgi:acyl carrier protein